MQGEISSDGSEEFEAVTSSGVHPSASVDVDKIPAVSGDSKPSTNSVRPQLVQLGSSQSSVGPPQPKRFSKVNIKMKFLEKNSSASSSTPISTGSTASKPAGPSSENALYLFLGQRG